MSRRAFIRWMLGLIVMISAATTALVKLLQRSVESQNVVKAKSDPVAALPKQEPPESKATPEDDKSPLFSFMLLSDLHISVYDPNTIKHMKEALEDIKKFESPIDAIVLTGDLTDYGGDDGYAELQKLLSAYKLPPLYANMGNHDYYDIWIDKKGAFNKDTVPNGKTDWQARERFQKFFKMDKTYQTAVIKGFPLIVMSQEAYVQEKPEVGEGAWYSDEQMDWFKEQLAKYNGKPMFVMTHQPLPPIGSDGGSHQLIRAKQFRELLKFYKNVFVFCGHRHQDFQNGTEHYVKETFHYFHNSSVGRVLGRNFQNDATKDKSQGLYVQVFKDHVLVRGREFSNRSWLKEADWNIKLTY
ncbi:metallophosphoesterase family protein [Paenibacillus radicis (ex Xue et al. 2023)]|uniref:Metallophosphoesterase n=1 Tax=Paenibacillus radicis (ex Xue et al. 2023) TaxID=2972489 RepID=A0ABT1YMK8_9BACL|nr:metallophosphoesterase [Paenibacillus radicis (ex Xue et al. 2023)]MCR8633225.1 metallophosphoesterase [Paenibacillus radicis (ex Xue et al. 2023)]